MISALSAFVFVTPIFGFSLSIDLPALELADPASIAQASVPADIAAAPTTPAEEVSPEAAAATEEPAVTDEAPAQDVAALMAKRARFARIHRIMGLSTWASMTVTVALGTLQYANKYGFFDRSENTRCDTGHNVFFGADACLGTPTPHAAAAALTSLLYYTTFGLSYGMPDPIGLDRGDSRAARRLRQHKRLRWAHFTGMALQIVLGTLSANSQWLGIDRANDYRATQALATVHLLSGYMTYATLTWAGALMAARH